MQLSGKTLVVCLSGPLNVQEDSGRITGRSNITRVRLRTAVREALRRKCVLYATIKEKEARAFARDVREVRKHLPLPADRIVVETGAEHTLANAWFALKHAYEHAYDTLVVVTSSWHMPRVAVAFRGMVKALGIIMGRTVAVEFVGAKFSRRPHVQRFEREVMVPAEREWKCEEERRRIEAYAAALAHAPLVCGFVAHPDVLCPYRYQEGRTYQSQVERAIA